MTISTYSTHPTTMTSRKRYMTSGKTSLTKTLFLMMVLFLIQGCTHTQPVTPIEAPHVYPESKPSLFSKDEVPAKAEIKHVAMRDESEKVVLKPKFKELSPLDTERISASFTEESYRPIFQILARAAGLNLVLAPELDALIGASKLTAEYQEIKVRTILDAICAIFDVTWREEHSTLFIEPFLSKIVHLDFLSQLTHSSFSVGGDVLGGTAGSAEEITSPLTGRFEISGEVNNTVTDVYSNIEKTVGKRIADDGDFLLNRQTGTLMMRARPQLIKEMERYLNTLRKKYSKQVLIEAQIIEISLNESQQFGIDWQNISLFTSTLPLLPTAETIVNFSSNNSSTDSMYNLVINTQDYSMSAIFSALQEYGNLKVLSKPRIKTMNGQSAAISVGQSVSYLKSLEKTTEGTGDDRTVEITTEIGALFDGILLGVTPIIKADNSVTLHVVPIKSEIVSLEQESLGAVDAFSVAFPVVNLREISTIINMQPKSVAVLGGLIMEREQDIEAGLPFLGDLPYIGKLFKHTKTSKQTVEMVIILKVDVIE